MGIPERTLEGWTNTGADQGSMRTRIAIYGALRSERSALEQKQDDYDVHLQGSYKNSTHIRGDSDVDVIARLESAWHSDLSELSNAEVERYEEDTKDAEYGRDGFRSDVVRALEIKFDKANVTQGDKAIKISSEAKGLPLDADVVACQDHRRYTSYPADDDPVFDTGIYFESQSDEKIINYPKMHHSNGIDKNTDADENYKPTVRMFKNARNNMRDDGIIPSEAAPSYYVEGLLYSVPNEEFKESELRTRYDSIVAHLEDTDISDFDEQCEMFPLFDSSDESRWTKVEGDDFVSGLRELWEDW